MQDVKPVQVQMDIVMNVKMDGIFLVQVPVLDVHKVPVHVQVMVNVMLPLVIPDFIFITVTVMDQLLQLVH